MNLRRLKTDKKGYTLIEIITVLVIIGIVASIALGGLIMYQRHAAFKKNNEYAQTLFSAAQASLSHAKVSGQLEELREELKESKYDDNKLEQEMIVHGADITKRTADGGLYFLCYKKGEKLTRENKAEKLLYDMLEGYVYDGTILNAAFCVEFDAVDGTVLGVLYSDKAKELTYNQATTGERGIVNICDRAEKVRKEALIGYYGIEKLSARAPENTKAVFDKVELVNDETLRAEWSLNEESSGIKADTAKYEIQLMRYKEEGNEKKEQLLASFVVNDSSAGVDENKLKSQGGDTYVKCRVQFYDDKGAPDGEVLEYQFPAWIDPAKKMTLVLDAVDIAAQNALADKSLKSNAEKFKNTYSIRRFIDRPEEVFIKIQAYEGEVSTESTDWEASNAENAYFKSVKKDEKASSQNVEIVNARHLFNIRFAEADMSDAAANTEVISTQYQQTQDIIWNDTDGIVKHGNVFVNQVAAAGKASFPALSIFGEHNIYEGNGKKIRMLLVVEDDTSEAKEPLGLFGINRGIIRNLTMTDCVIEGKNTSYAGSFCGVNAGTLENLTADGDWGHVTAGNYVGGIAGSDGYGYVGADGLRESGRKRVYKGLVNKTIVTGGEIGDSKAGDLSQNSQPDPDKLLACNFTGGIVGYLKGTYLDGKDMKDETVLIEGFENSGNVRSVYSESSGKSFAGGLFGYAENVAVLHSNVHDCEILAEGHNDNRGNTAAYVGGFVGYLANGSIGTEDDTRNGTSNKLSGNGSVTVNFGNIGGLVGKNDAGSTVEGCITEAGWEIISEKYMTNTGCGGIIGFNTSPKRIYDNHNAARVAKDNRAENMSGTGGIIGRQGSSEPFTVEQCSNSGEVSAYILPGGIIGRVAQKGGIVSKCTNSGNIYTVANGSTSSGHGTDIEGASGIVANIFSVSGTMTITECTNEAAQRAAISGKYGGNAGILASVSGNTTAKINITDCTNAGIIESENNSIKNAGIAANLKNANGAVTVSGCENYGTGSSRMCGIAAQATSKTTLIDNFGVSSCGIPVVPSKCEAIVQADNYYFSNLVKKRVDISQNMEVKHTTVLTDGRDAAITEGEKDFLTDGDLNTRCSYQIATHESESIIMILFKKPTELKSLDLYWYDEQDDGSDGKPRAYNYTLSYLQSSNDKPEDAVKLFVDEETKKQKVFTGLGYKQPYLKNADSVDLTSENVEKAHGIMITVKGHTHTNPYVSLFEIVLNDDRSSSGSVYEAEENIDTKGTPLGVTEKGTPYHAMNREKELCITDDLTVDNKSPLELKTGCSAALCREAYKVLPVQLNVKSGLLDDSELGSAESGRSSFLSRAVDAIENGAYELWDIITPFDEINKEELQKNHQIEAEVKQEEKIAERSEQQDKTDNGSQTSEENIQEEQEEVQEQVVTEPKKQELPELSETVLSDSDIPQTAVCWNEEAYIKGYDIELKANEDETYHYLLSRNTDGGEEPYQILHETDEADENGQSIWEEMPAREDEYFPKTEILSNGTTVTTYYYPLGYERIIDGIMSVENVTENFDSQEQETDTTENAEVPCQTSVSAYIECVVSTCTDGTVSRKLYLVLPDIETEEGIQAVFGTEQEYCFTSDIIITNISSDTALYEAPAPCHWWREQDINGSWTTKYCELGKEKEQ